MNLLNGQNNLSVFYYKIFFIPLLFLITKLNAQSVSGFIYNENNEALPGAIVSLIDPGTEDILSYIITNDKGFFILPNIKNGSYTISINAIGYTKIENRININGDLKNNYILTPEREQKIEEVILTATRPIKVKSDTIEVNAKSFLNGTEKNVEDLLKKLPGVTVEDDGKIKVEGKEIEKVMVENDDFFEKGYTLLTKNMSVKPIDKVQILQNYSNNKLLKGVENSDKVAINLTLEDKAKRDWFGSTNLSSSFFPESFYSEKINLAKFGKKAKYFLSGSINTIGTDAIGDIDHLIKPSIQDEPGFINIDSGAHTFGTDSFIFSPFGSEKATFNNDKLVSANAIFRLSQKAKLKIVSLGNFKKTFFNKNSITDFNFANTQFTNIEDFYRNSRKENYFNKLDFEYDISKKATLKYSGNINYWNNNSNENRNFNGLPWNIDQKTNNHSTDHSLLITNKINRNWVWLNGIRFLHQNISDFNNSDQFFFGQLFTNHDQVQNFNQSANSKFQFLGIISQILYRTENENLWDFSFFNQKTIQKFSNIMGFEENSSLYFFSADFKNDFKNNNNNFGSSLKYTLSLENFKINPKLDIHYTNNRFEGNYQKKEDFFYVIPSLNVAWAVHNKGKLNASVFLSRNNTEMLDMLPNYFSETPRSLIKGINDFEYLKNSGATLKYSYGNWSDRVFINLYGSYTKYHNYLSSNYAINQTYTIADLLFLKNRNDYLFSGEVNYYLKKIRSNFKISYTTNRSQYEDQIDNGSFRNVTSLYNRIGFQLKSGWKKSFNYTLGTNLNISKIKTDLKENKVLNQQAFLELFFDFNEKTKIEVKNNYYSFNGYFNKNNSYNFLDLKINYQYDKNISLSFIGNNLFNVKNFKETTITSYSTYTTAYKLFPRYLILELTFGL